MKIVLKEDKREQFSDVAISSSGIFLKNRPNIWVSLLGDIFEGIQFL